MSSQAPAIPDNLDSSTQAGKQAASRRWWMLATVFVIAPIGLLLMAVLAGVVWYFGQHRAALAKVEAEVARIQAAGEPITVEDLYARSRVPAGTRDTTPLWLAALNSVNERTYTIAARSVPIVGEGNYTALPATDVSAAEVFLAKYDATVQATLVAAAAKGECRIPVEFNDGYGALLPNTQRIRLLSRLLALRCRVAVARGDTERAVESVEAMFEASQTLAQQQVMVEHLVRLAAVTMALRETEFLLKEVPLYDDHLALLRRNVEAIDVQSGLVAACLGERGMGYHAFHHPEQIDMAAGRATRKSSTGPGFLARPIDCLLTLELHQELIAASHQPFPEAIDAASQVENRLASIVGTSDPLEKYQHRYTMLLFPAVWNAFHTTARGLAHRDLVLAAIAARQFEQKHGQLPDSLAALVPEFLPAVPTDPFDGKALRFQITDEGLVLYSIGRDRKDDGGSDPDLKGEPDIAVRLVPAGMIGVGD